MESHESDRRSIQNTQIDMAQQQWASQEYCNCIYQLYYKDYKEKPFISKDRELYTNLCLEREKLNILLRYNFIPDHMLYGQNLELNTMSILGS